MDDIRSIHLKILQRQLSTIARELAEVRFLALPMPRTWSPRLNVYRCRDRLVICAELAGVDRAEIELRVEPRRVWLSGRRRAPVPEQAPESLRQILALEIDDGRFEREVILPVDIVPGEVWAEQRNGLLWIDLPLPLPGASARTVEPLNPS